MEVVVSCFIKESMIMAAAEPRPRAWVCDQHLNVGRESAVARNPLQDGGAQRRGGFCAIHTHTETATGKRSPEEVQEGKARADALDSTLPTENGSAGALVTAGGCRGRHSK